MRPRPATQLDLAKERDSGRQARWAVWLIGAGRLLGGVLFAVMADGFVRMVRFGIENPSSDEVPPGMAQLMVASMGSAVASPLSLVGMAFLLIWFHRAVANGVALGHKPPREPVLAVASWFIPIVNFWWPYESLRECVSEHDAATRALIKRWWIVYLATAFGLLFRSPVVAVWLPLSIPVATVGVALVVYEVSLARRVVSAILADHSAIRNA